MPPGVYLGPQGRTHDSRGEAPFHNYKLALGPVVPTAPPAVAGGKMEAMDSGGVFVMGSDAAMKERRGPESWGNGCFHINQEDLCKN